MISGDISKCSCEWHIKEDYTWCCHMMRAGGSCSFLWCIFPSTAAVKAFPFSLDCSPVKQIKGMEVQQEGERKHQLENWKLCQLYFIAWSVKPVNCSNAEYHCNYCMKYKHPKSQQDACIICLLYIMWLVQVKEYRISLKLEFYLILLHSHIQLDVQKRRKRWQGGTIPPTQNETPVAVLKNTIFCCCEDNKHKVIKIHT